MIQWLYVNAIKLSATYAVCMSVYAVCTNLENVGTHFTKNTLKRNQAQRDGGKGMSKPEFKTAVDPSYSLEEARTLIGVGNTKMWSLLKAGEFPRAYKAGKCVRIPESDVVAYRDRHRFQGTAA